jgi:LysM repeat protein
MNHHLVVPEDQNYEKNQLVPMIRDGHSALSGPLANVGIAFDGTIYVIAGNPANHAGMGRRDVLTRVMNNQAPRGNAADVYGSGSDDYSSGNVHYFGAELQHRGTHPDYPDVQIRATYAWNAALLRTIGAPAERAIHHREHSYRKIDLSWRGDLRAGTRLMLTGGIKPLPPKEWDELATKEELAAVFDDRIRAVVPGIVNDVVAAVLRAPEFNLSTSKIVQGRGEDVFRATVAVLHAPEFAGWQEVTRRAAAVILKGEPPVVVPPVIPPAAQTYTVVAGDTLSKIATKFGVTVADLVAWNNLTDPNNISVGQVLKVSAPKA